MRVRARVNEAGKQGQRTAFEDPPKRLLALSLMYAFSGAENSRHAVQPLEMMYSTCLAMSRSERGGRNEKVSKTLQAACQSDQPRVADDPRIRP